MYYLTRYNFASLLYKLVIDIPSIFEYSFYSEHKLTYFDFIDLKYFSVREQRRLVIFDKILHDTEKTMKQIQILKRNNNQKMWVYKISLPCYHKNKDCPYLNSNFINTPIPSSLSENKVEEYREFFIKNQRYYAMNDFYEILKSKFSLEEDQETIFNMVKKGNSGVNQIEEENIISDTKKKWDFFTDIISEKHFYLSQVRNLYKCRDDKDISSIYEHKKDIMETIINYYFKILNESDISIDEKIYQLAGFSPCPHCMGKSKD